MARAAVRLLRRPDQRPTSADPHLEAARERADRAQVTQLKAVVRQELGLSASAVVILIELCCDDAPGVPGQTLLAVLDRGRRMVWRLHHPLRRPTPEHLRAALGRDPATGRP
jgi:hypothetical protein